MRLVFQFIDKDKSEIMVSILINEFIYQPLGMLFRINPKYDS